MPTIYAENRESFTDGFSGHKVDDDDDDNDNESDNDFDRKMPATTTTTTTNKLDGKSDKKNKMQDEFVPAQLQLKPNNNNGKHKKKYAASASSILSSSKEGGGGDKKKKDRSSSSSSSSSKKKPSPTSTSTKTTILLSSSTAATTPDDASWNDLGDEIASALHQSLIVDNDYAPMNKKKAASSSNKQKKDKKKMKKKNNNSDDNNPTKNNDDEGNDDNDDDDSGPPWKCPACTFKNQPLHLVCAVCGTAAVAIPSPPLTKSGGSTSSRHAAAIGGGMGSSSSGVSGSGALYDSNLSHTRYYGSSSENLFDSSLGPHSMMAHQERRSSSESLTRSYSNNNQYLDPHSHRRMMGQRRQSDEIMSNNDSELRDSFNNNEHRARRTSREYADDRRRLSEDDYYSARPGSSLRRSNTNEGQQQQQQQRNNERTKFSQSMQVNSISERGGILPERGYSGGSVSSGRHHSRSTRRRPESMYDDDSISRRSRNSRDDYHRGGGGGGGSSKDYRKSTMMDMEYGGYEREGGRGSGSVGRYRGSRSRDEGRYRSDDHSEASESLGTKGRITGGQYYDDGGSIISEMSDDEATFAERTVKTMQTIKKMVIPSGDVTIIYTDVQGSTALWEADAMAMKKATDIHDSIIRRCYSDHGGYEITTEGDAFNLAFQHPADAIGFALKAQLALYRAKWPDGTLNHPDGCDNEKKKFRGFRVRFGMHHGPTTSTVHKTTGRTTYQGEAVEIAKAIEKMSHGGQILSTVETWRTVSGMAEQLLGSPQVMDCGEHLLWDPKKSDLAKKKSSSKKVLSKRIVQLVPNSLSYDFFAARGGQEVKEGEAPQRVCGRVFPPLLSHGQLSTSFLNAPYIGNKVAMVFVYTDKMEALADKERKKNYKILAKYVRSHLMRLSPPGYECQEDKGSWMLAFDRIDNGINFGLDLKENVMKNAKLLGDVDKSQVFRVGIHWGPFLSMGPHTVTGHADYFGPIVNRAARVAAQCEPGQVCVGVPMGTDEEPPDPGPTVDVLVLGVKQLKGISIEMAIFGCQKKDPSKTIEEEES